MANGIWSRPVRWIRTALFRSAGNRRGAGRESQRAGEKRCDPCPRVFYCARRFPWVVELGAAHWPSHPGDEPLARVPRESSAGGRNIPPACAAWQDERSPRRSAKFSVFIAANRWRFALKRKPLTAWRGVHSPGVPLLARRLTAKGWKIDSSSQPRQLGIGSRRGGNNLDPPHKRRRHRDTLRRCGIIVSQGLAPASTGRERVLRFHADPVRDRRVRGPFFAGPRLRGCRCLRVLPGGHGVGDPSGAGKAGSVCSNWARFWSPWPIAGGSRRVSRLGGREQPQGPDRCQGSNL